MKRFLFLFIFLLNQICLAQYEPQFSQFWLNKSTFNPAFTASKLHQFANVSYRLNPIAFSSKSQSVNINYDAKILNKDFGIGGGYSYNPSYLINSNVLNLKFAHHKVFVKNNNILYGISSGISVNYNLIKVLEKDFIPQVISEHTPNKSQGKVNINAGIVLYSKRDLILGLSVTQINSPIYDELYDVGVHPENFRNYYVYASKKYSTANALTYFLPSGSSLIPSLLFRFNTYQTAFDFNLKFNHKLIYGISYRKNNTLGLQIGKHFKKYFQVLYGIDLSFSIHQPYFKTFHEMSLTYRLTK